MTAKNTKDKVLNYEKFLSEYERGLLNLAFKDKNILLELIQKITYNYFLYPPHRIIYTALCNLLNNPKVDKIEVSSLYIECESLGIKNYNIQPEYIYLITEGKFDVGNFDFYLSKVRNAYLKAALNDKLEEALLLVGKNAADSPNTPTGEALLELVNTELSNLYNFQGKSDEAVKLADRVESFVLERSANPTDVVGIRTGIPSLDVAINGLMPGTLTLIAGRAKAGKSTAMMNIVDFVAIQGGISTKEKPEIYKTHPVLVISTEMYTDEDLCRLLAMRSLVEERKIANGIAYNDPQTRKILEKAIQQVKNSEVYHVYMPQFNASKVTNLIEYYKLKYNIGLAVFDYIKMSTTGDEERDKKEYQVLGDITTALKNAAGKLKIPILSGCQVNRNGRVADSDRLERYCNTLIEFRAKTLEELNQQNFEKYGTHWLDVITTRGGGNIKIPIRFWKKCLKIEEAEFFEEQDEESTSAIPELTTPRDWQKKRTDAFRIQKVDDILSETDTYDLQKQIEEDDPLF